MCSIRLPAISAHIASYWPEGLWVQRSVWSWLFIWGKEWSAILDWVFKMFTIFNNTCIEGVYMAVFQGGGWGEEEKYKFSVSHMQT